MTITCCSSSILKLWSEYSRGWCENYARVPKGVMSEGALKKGEGVGDINY